MDAASRRSRRLPAAGPKKSLAFLAAIALFLAIFSCSRASDGLTQVAGADLTKLTVLQLKDRLRRRNLKVGGKKAELVARLREHSDAAPPPVVLPAAQPAVQPAAQLATHTKESPRASYRADCATDVSKWSKERVQWSKMLEERGPGTEELYQDAEARLQSHFEMFPEMKETLRPQQIHSIQECLLRRGRCLIADEMGLGKTLSSLVAAQIFAEEWPMLVVAPAGVVKNWVQEVKKWLPHLASEVKELNKQVLGKRADLQKAWVEKLIFVVSYDQVRRHPSLGVRPDGSPYKVVILDEAHYIKTTNSQRTEALMPVCRDATRCILLTGTPVMNHAGEIWTLMSALDPALPTFENFCERYCEFKERIDDNGDVVRIPTGVKNAEELHKVFGSFLVRQRKSEVLTNLGAKTKFKLNFREKIDGHHVQKIMAISKSFRGVRERQRLPQKVWSLTAKAKAVPVTEYVQSVLEKADPDCKIVVFGHHMVILDRIQKMMMKLGLGYVRLDGKVDKIMRQARIEKFQEDPDVQVALVGMKACGQGISLTAARKVIFAELHWVPATLLQAEDRVHRHGQQNDVEVVYCVVEGKPFMDDAILSKLESKEKIANMITEGQEMESAFAPLLSKGD